MIASFVSWTFRVVLVMQRDFARMPTCYWSNNSERLAIRETNAARLVSFPHLAGRVIGDKCVLAGDVRDWCDDLAATFEVNRFNPYK